MGVRVCKGCGREYRGLVCQGCHPRGSGERGGQRGGQNATRPAVTKVVRGDYAEYWLCACGECVGLADQVCPVCGARRPPLAEMFGGKADA